MKHLLPICSTAIALIFLASAAVTAMPLGNPNAPQGGSLVVGIFSYPKNIHYYLANDEVANMINALVIESLMENDLETFEITPRLASHWKISDDKKTFTVTLDKNARFSDGKKVTADDVVFTWQTIMNPKNKTAPYKSYYSSFESCKKIDDQTVQFVAKTIHFKSLQKIADLLILPKHIYSKGDFNKSFNEVVVGSGPYEVKKIEIGKRVVIKRNKNYWGTKLEQNIGRYNFDEISFKAVADVNVQYEMFKRGDIDYFHFSITKMWETETNGPGFENNYIKKLKAENKSPSGTHGIAWNLRKPLFSKREVRLALSHLLDRDKLIKELFYHNYLTTSGVVPFSSEYRSPKNQPIPYDPKKARELLKEAGWTTTDGNGVLIKNNLRFEFEILSSSPMLNRVLTIYQEELKKMGIKMHIRNVDWATEIRLADDREFDAVVINRGRDVEPSDFHMMWGSLEADIKGSSNLTGYKNTELDRLAHQVNTTFEKEKRVPLVQKIDEIIAHDQPMTFCWEPMYYRLAYWNKYSFPKKGYFSYSSWKDTFYYWWYDKEKAEKLAKARAAGTPLN